MENLIVILGGRTEMSIKEFINASDNHLYNLDIDDYSRIRIDKLSDIFDHNKYSYISATKNAVKKSCKIWMCRRFEKTYKTF